MQHSLYSENKEMVIKWFGKFDKEEIKKSIIEYLTENPSDVIEHCKEFNRKDVRSFYGNEILNFYKTNPKNLRVCKVIIKGNKEYLKELDY